MQPVGPWGHHPLCRCRNPGCQQTFRNRPVYHVDMLRWRYPSSIGEAWATNLPPVEQEEEEADVEALDNFDDRVAELRRRLLSAREGPAPDADSSRRRTHAQRLIETAERHEGGRERSRRRRQDRLRSHSSNESVFDGAPSAGNAMGADSLRLRAKQSPGLLWRKALTEIQRYLGQRGVTLPQGLQELSNFVTYLTAIFHGLYPQEAIGPRDSRELRTIAKAFDLLGNGNLAKTANLLVRWFTAVEKSVKKGNWEDSSFLELIRRDAVGLTSQQEKLMAQRGRLLDQRLTGKTFSSAR